MMDGLRSLFDNFEIGISLLGAVLAALSLWVSARGAASVLTRTEKRFTVAVSYSHVDRDKARPIVKALRRRGVNTFFDEDNLSIGSDIAKATRNVFTTADYVLVLHTSSYKTSAWVAHELKAALAAAGREGRILPVMLDSSEIEDPAIAGRLYLDARDLTAEEIADQLASSIRS